MVPLSPVMKEQRREVAGCELGWGQRQWAIFTRPSTCSLPCPFPRLAVTMWPVLADERWAAVTSVTSGLAHAQFSGLFFPYGCQRAQDGWGLNVIVEQKQGPATQNMRENFHVIQGDFRVVCFHSKTEPFLTNPGKTWEGWMENTVWNWWVVRHGGIENHYDWLPKKLKNKFCAVWKRHLKHKDIEKLKGKGWKKDVQCKH